MANVYDCYATAQALGLVGLAGAFEAVLRWMEEEGHTLADARLRVERIILTATRLGYRDARETWEKVAQELEG